MAKETHDNPASNTGGRIFSESAGSSPSELRQDTGEFNVIFVHSRLDDYGLPAPVFRVYCHLARRAGRGSAWPAVVEIARVCRLHAQTVRKALRLLVSHRLLHREYRPGSTTIYRLTPASAWHPPKHIDGSPSQSDAPPSDSHGRDAKRMPGQPCETDGAKGNPFEGNPMKGQHTHALAVGLPQSVEEAIKVASELGIDEQFARQEYHAKKAVGWKGGYGNPISSWPDHLLSRWPIEQRKRAERRAGGRASGKRPGAPPRQFTPENYQQSQRNF